MTPPASDSEGVHASDKFLCPAKAVPVLAITSEISDSASTARTARVSAKTAREFSDCASTARTARISARKARTSVTAVQTVSFFKGLADVLHARMDSLEARIERELEAMRGSHSKMAEELVELRESQAIITEDMSSNILCQEH